MKKLLKISTLIFAVLLLIPTSASASTGALYGAGEWDFLGSESMTLDGGKSNSIYKSGGGHLKVCIYNVSYEGDVTFELHEKDGGPLDNLNEKYVTEHVGSNGVSCIIFGDGLLDAINHLVDGKNNKAEFKIRLNSGSGGSGENVFMKVWD